LSFAVIVRDASGARTLDEKDLPLSIGSTAESTIRIPGSVALGQVAQIGLLDGRAFVQVPGQGDVHVNGEPVTSTRWLLSGDELTINKVRLSCVIDAVKLTVEVDYRDVEYETTPPVLQPPGNDDPATITPIKIRSKSRVTQPVAQHKRGKYLLAGVFAVLVIAALYIFTAVTVVIRADQENAQITLADSWLTPGSDGRYLLWPGSYTAVIDAPGFYPLAEEFVVAAGGRAEFEFQLEELPGRLTVETIPDSTGELWIDGEQVGSLSSAEVTLAQGDYELRIRTPRFLDYIATVEIVGRDQQQTLTAKLLPGWADVAITSLPPDAEILLGDDLLGITPATVELLAGMQTISVRKEGFRTEQRTINIVAGQAEEVPLVELAAAGGFLRINSVPAGAAVTVENEFVGNTPLELEVAKGRSFKLRLTKAGYQQAARKVAVPDGTPVDILVQMQAKTGVVRLNVQPADAVLYVAGKQVGVGSKELALIAVPQQIEVRRAGYKSWSQQVTPRPGLPQSFNVELLTPQQAVLAAIPRTVTTSQGQVLRLIEPGEFMMGAQRREQGRRPNEVKRSVKLTRRFYMALNEVTNREFSEFRPQHTSGAEKYRELAADSHPAVMLSWAQAAEYCNWLSARDGLPSAYVKQSGRYALVDPATEGYRLPTEAEWTWVARYNAGGGAQKYSWGSGMPPPVDAGNYADSYAVDVVNNTIGGYTDGYPVTAPIGSFPPSPLGIYDLGGNVAEWVNDRYTVTTNNGAQLLDPTGPAEGQYHVIRGSSWRQASISELRLSYRDFGVRGRLDVGFRIARYVVQPD
jgi:formylglycine-generating enzyme required for sulfatase activity